MRRQSRGNIPAITECHYKCWETFIKTRLFSVHHWGSLKALFVALLCIFYIRKTTETTQKNGHLVNAFQMSSRGFYRWPPIAAQHRTRISWPSFAISRFNDSYVDWTSNTWPGVFTYLHKESKVTFLYTSILNGISMDFKTNACFAILA